MTPTLFPVVPTTNIPTLPGSTPSTIVPNTPTLTATPEGTPTLVPSTVFISDLPTAEPNTLVEAEWPARIKARQSGTIRVSIIKTNEGYTPIVEIPSNTAVASTPIPVGTPEADLPRKFGEGYEAYAVAHIAGASFDISLASPESQSLDQSRIDWIWNITSDSPGLQGLDLSVEIEWKPVGNTGESIRRQIWRSHIVIDIFQPIVTSGQVSAFSLFSAFLGSGLSIPWIYEIVSKRRSQQRRKDKKRR
jgi:hypothetical protein